MSPSAERTIAPAVDRIEDKFNGLNLRIVGMGVQYPPHQVGPEALETVAARFYPSSPALKKVLTINKYTGIDTRSSIGTVEHPLATQPDVPTIDQLSEIYLEEGVDLSVSASRKAIEEWGGDVRDITHIVSTTCTNSANPGFDHFVAKKLGIEGHVEKVLLHGVGCSGGLAALRTASNLALGASFRKRPARILIVACEISSVMVRSELDSVSKNDEVRIGACLFSDCASAVILSNGIGKKQDHRFVYELLAWEHAILQDTEKDLGFDVHPQGWKVVLSPRVPKLASAAVAPAYEALMRSMASYAGENLLHSPLDFDWALHPGGSTIITSVEKAMKLTPEHLRASYETYINHGNSSSATVFSVLDRLRKMGAGKEHVVSCAFGPGIAIEMMLLKRNMEVESPSLDALPVEALD